MPLAGHAVDPVLSLDVGARYLRAFECSSGELLGSVVLRSPVTAGPAVDPRRASVFVGAGASLLRLGLPDLTVHAERTLEYQSSKLAIGRRPDGLLVLAGPALNDGAPGSAPTPWVMRAYQPLDLSMAHDWPLAGQGPIASLRAIDARSRFVAAFVDRDEIWEMAWNRDADPVLRGLVHDYRSGEAVALPGQFTPRVFKVPVASRDLLAGGAAFEMLQIDRLGHASLVNLDIRRVTEGLALPEARLFVAWRSRESRGWLAFHENGEISRVTASPARVDTVGRLQAPPIGVVADQAGSSVLVLHPIPDRRGDTFVVSRLSALATAPLLTVERLVNAPAGAVRLAGSVSERCVALLAQDGRWLAAIADSAVEPSEVTRR